MPTCYQLIGVPGSGKSTWTMNQIWAKDCAIVSTDNHVENQAKLEGKTYNEVFKAFMPTAVNLMANDVVKASAASMDIIWDQTSTTIASRKKKFAMLPTYKHIAVVFATPPKAELSKRLKSRIGKHIPKHVIERMINGWQDPTLDEGFAEIWFA
jgi:predicted kinase